MSGISATTRNTEIARNLHQPEGWRRDGIDSFVAPPSRYTLASRRCRFANSTPSRSPQILPYLGDEALWLRLRSKGLCGLDLDLPEHPPPEPRVPQINISSSG